MSHPLLNIHQISIGFQTDNGFRETLQQVDFQLYKNEILGIVGESGSGKSLTSLAVLGLLPSSAKITEGEILYNGEDLSTLSTKQLRKIRGKEISMIFQEPMSSLNPSMKCGPQVTEILLEHTALSKKEAKAETLRLFEKVKLPRPESIYDVYPHQIS
ncbi:ATP-binding cassette domain-containing protein, partial [Mesonia mobilis]